MKTEAWVLQKGISDLVRTDITISDELKPGQVLIEPLLASWEANMSHAVQRNPIDLCVARKEDSVVLGNSGVVRVLSKGTKFQPGDICVFFANLDDINMDFGFGRYVHGYDAPGTVGLLSKKTIAYDHQLVKIPNNSKLNLEQWASFSVRYTTGWANWKVTKATYRAMVPFEKQPSPHICGWGGATTLAFLQRAKLDNFSVSMISSKPERLKLIESLGITPIDRREFSNLDCRKNDSAHIESEKYFLKKIRSLTEGRGAAIFADFIGEPVFNSTIKALARPGIITTAGWKEGMNLNYRRGSACVNWHIHINSHMGNKADIPAMMADAENTDWSPPLAAIDEPVDWLNVVDLYKKFDAGLTNYMPLIQVNKL